MKRKVIFLTFKALPFFLLALLILSSLLLSGCSPSDIIFGPSGSIEVDTYPAGAKIFLNGNDTGHITPYTIENLVKGTYEITVTLGDLSYTEKVIVYSDITTSVYKDLLPRLNKIVVQPTSMNLKEGDSQTIDSITAYYFDSGPAVIKLSACSYSSNSNHATVNSVGTITGISKGSAIITVSYTDVEITKTDTVNINITTIPPPTAVIKVSPGTTGIAPFTVAFDASDSFGYSIVSYRWNFGDGNISTGIAITHTYNNVGMYIVSLTVTDSDGKKGYDTVIITVNEEPIPEIDNITVSANPESNVPGGISTISAIVINAEGDAVADGTSVYFYTNSGELSADSSKTTNGIAKVDLTLDDNMQAGENAKVTAFIGTVSGYIEVKCIDVIITIYADNLIIIPLGETTITAIVTDTIGNPVEDGIIVIFFTDVGLFDLTSSTMYKVTSEGVATTGLTLKISGDVATIIAKCGSRVSNKIIIKCK